MDSNQFVDRLSEIAPTISELKQSGLSADEAERFRKRYLFLERDHPTKIGSDNRPLIRLLNRWDGRNIRIGMVQFAAAPAHCRHGIQVGTVEADPLIVLTDGEIAVREAGTSDHVLWWVARDDDRLLDALIVAARFLKQCGDGTVSHDDFEEARRIATECAAAAGGEKYLPFYKMLVGVAT